MKLYVSYWYQVRFFPRNLICLSTVVWPPKYQIKDSTGQPAIIIDCPPFKPGAACDGLCNGKCEIKHPHDCDFLKEYGKQLDAINTDDFLNHLKKLADKIMSVEHFNNVDFAFIVYEATKNPCSERQEIMRWGKEHNIEIEEWRGEK